MTKIESENQRRFGSLISLPLFVLFAVLGFGSPVFFSAISQTSLEDVGEGTKTLDEEMVRQLRQNNLGPAEMLLPLTSVDRREEYSESIDKKMTPKLEISGGGSIFDLLAFESYFGGLDKFNTDRKRYEAFFVYNKATVQGDLQKRLSEESSNTNVRALLQAIPKEGRPGNFWSRLLAEPMVSAFPGVKMVEIVGFPFFPDRKIILSVGLQNLEDMDSNKSEAEIRDQCMASARNALAECEGSATWFSVKKNKTSADVGKLDGNQTMPPADFKDLSERLGLLKVGRTNTGAYAVIIGGIMNSEGDLESHGRWLPFPILIPMMVGTAMAVENGYYSDEASFEIGKLAQQTLLGNLEAKEKLRAFFWAAHQLARKMNLMQMAELTKSCPDLQGVFDLAAMVRMRNRPLSVSIGKIKKLMREINFLPLDERADARNELAALQQDGEVIRKNFESELKIIYSYPLECRCLLQSAFFPS